MYYREEENERIKFALEHPRNVLLNFLIVYTEKIEPELERGRINGLARHIKPFSDSREYLLANECDPGVREAYVDFNQALRRLESMTKRPDLYSNEDLSEWLPEIGKRIGSISDALIRTALG